MPRPRPATDLQATLQRGTSLLKAGASGEALAVAEGLIRDYPDAVDAYLLASHAEQRRGRFDAMLAHAKRAETLRPSHFAIRCRVLECLVYCGRYGEVRDRLQLLEAEYRDSAPGIARLAEFYVTGNRHDDAARCYRRAVELAPDDADFVFGLASAEIALGRLDEAERLLDRVIELNPHDYDAYRNRATLRRQTPENNHVDGIRARLAAGVRRPSGEAQLCYALAKECEDLGRDEEAFDWLARGAAARRRLLSYRVDGDVAVMDEIRQVYTPQLFAAAAPGFDREGPVFVLGLPRSGTTLVERILASHSKVHSLGEINDFAYGLMEAAGVGDKTAMVRRSAELDFVALGARYCRSTREYGFDAALLIDKTPLNYLYIGLIRLALPGAKIVHVARNPMDSCYGMYRTLFRAGYPFSYDFDDIAAYYAAYRRLMEHWRSTLPGAFLDVSYEALVDDPETVSRELVDYCGLDWERRCLDFHKNEAPVSTASSAQVRRPVYRDALQRWRRYERQLEPLRSRLRDAGIDA